jgi:hypothetical protein
MKSLSCAAARRKLQPFHDGELAVSDQIAVSAHVDRCGECRAVLLELQLLGSMIRASLPRQRALSRDEAASFQVNVVSRAKAERDASFLARVHAMFDDMHLVYAGFGAAVATAVCLVIMLGMMRFAADERPDSLAAMVAVLSSPSSSADLIAVDPVSHARWTARFQAANEIAEQDAVFALANVVARQGRISPLDRLRARGKAAIDQADLIEGLMDAVSRARLEGAADGVAAASSLVWLVTHTTVRATNTSRTLDLVLPASKKRAAIANPQLRPAIA